MELILKLLVEKYLWSLTILNKGNPNQQYLCLMRSPTTGILTVILVPRQISKLTILVFKLVFKPHTDAYEHRTFYTASINSKIKSLFYCQNSSSADIENSLRKFWTVPMLLKKENQQEVVPSFQMMSFVIEENNEIVLKTIAMHTSQRCRLNQLVEINTFSKTSLKWTTKTFFTPEINSFHGCQLNFQTPESESMIDSILRKGTMTSMKEISILISEGLARHLNYSAKFIQTATREFSTDLELVVAYTNENSDTSPPVFNDFFGILVPPGELYTSLEKLILPFDYYTWILFFLVFAVAYFVLLITKILKIPRISALIIGENVRTQAMNIYMIFMGGGMRRIPKKSFPRFILMIFILYCLIMR